MSYMRLWSDMFARDGVRHFQMAVCAHLSLCLSVCNSTVWELWLKAMFHRSDLVVSIAMHLYGTLLVIPDPSEVYAMQPQEPDVASIGLHESCSEKNCCITMENINNVVNALKDCVLENDRVDGDNGVNVGGICTLCEQSFDHIWRDCSGCICQACQQVLVNGGIYERTCLNKSGKVTRPLMSSSRHFARCYTCISRRESV